MSDDLVERLEPCPFCGSEARLYMPGDDRSWHWNVICTNESECGATFQDGERRAVAVETWNRRSNPRAEKAEADAAQFAEWAEGWHRSCQTIATILDLTEPEADTLAGLVRSVFEKAEAENKRLREAWQIAEDGLASIAGERTPKFFPETSWDCAKRHLKEARAALERNDG